MTYGRGIDYDSRLAGRIASRKQQECERALSSATVAHIQAPANVRCALRQGCFTEVEIGYRIVVWDCQCVKI